MSDVIKLADKTQDGTKWSVKDALQCAMDDVGNNGAFKDGKKVIILCLDDTSGGYNVNFIQAGMKMSECIALCEIAKSTFKEDMGY